MELFRADWNAKMIMPCDDRDGRCPVCNEAINGDGICPRCKKNSGGVDCSKQADPADWRPIVETMRCFLLSDEEAEAMMARIISDIELHWPRFLKRKVLEALLPLIQKRAQGFFLANRVPYCDAEDLSAKLVAKIWKASSEEWPRGNIGSWIATIRTRLLYDYWRAKRVEERWFGKQEHTAALANVEETDDESRWLLLEEFPAEQQELVERLLDGDKWQEIKARYGPKVEELRKRLMSMEWDGQSVPLRKRRRRRGRQ
jgi:DNA-directed RNA polymerase specialized sigma24 family protein